MRGLLGLALVVCAGCGVLQGCGDSAPPTEVEALGATPPAAPPSGDLEVAPALELEKPEQTSPTPPPPPFQPAFHQALRWSHDVPEPTTFRLFVPVGRAGERLRVTFRSGDGNLTLQRATVALANPDGTLASAPVPLTFNGAAGFSVDRRTRVTSDAASLAVPFRGELAVTFEARGSLAASAISAFPRSTARLGAHANGTGALGGERFERSVGLATIEVQAAPGRVFLAIGDSITEGYYDTFNDMRNAWPALAEKQLGVPVVNAGVSGQGFYDALQNLDQEVLALSGVTDCIILLGTNDMGGLSDSEQEARMSTLLDRLEPFCRLWVSTLLPKEKSNHGDYERVKSSRLSMNAWIRQLPPRATVIDLEAVTRQPGNVHLFIDGLEVDGIHPSPQGHRVMADEVVRVVRERWDR